MRFENFETFGNEKRLRKNAMCLSYFNYAYSLKKKKKKILASKEPFIWSQDPTKSQSNTMHKLASIKNQMGKTRKQPRNLDHSIGDNLWIRIDFALLLLSNLAMLRNLSTRILRSMAQRLAFGPKKKKKINKIWEKLKR